MPVALAASLVVLALPCAAHGSEPPPVAVASSLRFAWPALMADASRAASDGAAGATEAAGAAGAAGADGAAPVRPSFGASLTLAAQMLASAPFEVLVAADVESVQRLVDGGLVDAADVARFVDGRLAVAVRDDSPIAAAPTLDALAGLLRTDASTRIAIAHPDHAPYGRAALQALAHVGLDAFPAGRTARGENAAQALQFLLSGAVVAALVPTSLVTGAPEGTPLAWRDVPVDAHAPIRHALAPVHGASDASLALVAYLRSCAARDVLVEEGFAAPIDAPCEADAAARSAAGG